MWVVFFWALDVGSGIAKRVKEIRGVRFVPKTSKTMNFIVYRKGDESCEGARAV